MKRILIASLALLALLPAAARGAFPGRNGAIVYGAWSEDIVYFEDSGDESFDNWSIRVLPPSGEPRVLAHCSDSEEAKCTGAQYRNPAVSPDGTRIAFALGGALALADVDGSGEPEILPAAVSRDEEPAWSPSGKRLVFWSAFGLWISRDDGSHHHRLVALGSSPAWSTRNWIAFVRRNAIYRIRPDGSGLRLLARDARAPEWSPDGQHLAFSRVHVTRLGWDYVDGIQVMDADGSHRRMLPGRASKTSGQIAWSPDGRRLLIADEGRLTTMDLHGRHARAIPHPGDGDVFGIDWQPLH